MSCCVHAGAWHVVGDAYECRQIQIVATLLMHVVLRDRWLERDVERDSVCAAAPTHAEFGWTFLVTKLQ